MMARVNVVIVAAENECCLLAPLSRLGREGVASAIATRFEVRGDFFLRETQFDLGEKRMPVLHSLL